MKALVSECLIWACVTSRFSALHQWTEAPDHVAFLRNMHRHMFHVKLCITQQHTERDIEYITLKRKLDQHIDTFFRNRSSQSSCETMAVQILEWASREYPGRHIRCSVYEDGENGAEVHYAACE